MRVQHLSGNLLDLHSSCSCIVTQETPCKLCDTEFKAAGGLVRGEIGPGVLSVNDAVAPASALHCNGCLLAEKVGNLMASKLFKVISKANDWPAIGVVKGLQDKKGHIHLQCFVLDAMQADQALLILAAWFCSSDDE